MNTGHGVHAHAGFDETDVGRGAEGEGCRHRHGVLVDDERCAFHLRWISEPHRHRHDGCVLCSLWRYERHRGIVRDGSTVENLLRKAGPRIDVTVCIGGGYGNAD
jgi:hypothetical protein